MRAALTRPQVQAMIDQCADMAEDLCDAEPADIQPGRPVL